MSAGQEHILTKWRNMPRGFICRPTVDSDRSISVVKVLAETQTEAERLSIYWRKKAEYGTHSWGNGRDSVSWDGQIIYYRNKRIDTNLAEGTIVGAAVHDYEDGKKEIRLVFSKDNKTLDIYKITEPFLPENLLKMYEFMIPNKGYLVGSVKFSSDANKFAFVREFIFRTGIWYTMYFFNGIPDLEYIVPRDNYWANVDALVYDSDAFEFLFVSGSYIKIESETVVSPIITSIKIDKKKSVLSVDYINNNLETSTYSVESEGTDYQGKMITAKIYVKPYKADEDIKILDFASHYSTLMSGYLYNGIPHVWNRNLAEKKTKHVMFMTPEGDYGLISSESAFILLNGSDFNIKITDIGDPTDEPPPGIIWSEYLYDFMIDKISPNTIKSDMLYSNTEFGFSISDILDMEKTDMARTTESERMYSIKINTPNRQYIINRVISKNGNEHDPIAEMKIIGQNLSLSRISLV